MYQWLLCNTRRHVAVTGLGYGRFHFIEPPLNCVTFMTYYITLKAAIHSCPLWWTRLFQDVFRKILSSREFSWMSKAFNFIPQNEHFSRRAWSFEIFVYIKQSKKWDLKWLLMYNQINNEQQWTQAAQTDVTREGCNVIHIPRHTIGDAPVSRYIVTISTYTTGARSEMTRQLGSRSVKKRVLAPVV